MLVGVSRVWVRLARWKQLSVSLACFIVIEVAVNLS